MGVTKQVSSLNHFTKVVRYPNPLDAVSSDARVFACDREP